MPTVHSKIALVTGANKGIGKHTAAHLAAAGVITLVGFRDPLRGRAAVDELSTRAVTYGCFSSMSPTRPRSPPLPPASSMTSAAWTSWSTTPPTPAT